MHTLPLGSCVLEVKLKGAETLHLFLPSVCTSIITPQQCSTGGHHSLLKEHCVETFLASQLGEGCEWYQLVEARGAAEHFAVNGKVAYHQQPWYISSSVCVGGGQKQL